MNFVAIDFETANSNLVSACEVGLIKVLGGRVVGRLDLLIKPPLNFSEIAPINYSKHRISAEMLSDARSFDQLFPEIVKFVGSLPLVAHQASTDMAILNALGLHYDLPIPANPVFCTNRLAKAALELPSLSLKSVATYFEVEHLEKHRAGADAMVAAMVALAFLEQFEFESLEELYVAFGVFIGQSNRPQTSRIKKAPNRSRHVSTTEENSRSIGAGTVNHLVAIKNNPNRLAGLSIVVTGTLPSLSRDDAELLISLSGGKPSKTVTKKTSFVVAGPGSKNKLAAAIELGIEVIDQDEFLRKLY